MYLSSNGENQCNFAVESASTQDGVLAIDMIKSRFYDIFAPSIAELV